MSEPNTPAPLGRSPYTRDTPKILEQLHSDLDNERNKHDYLSQGLEENRQELEHQKASLERNQARMKDLMSAWELELLEGKRGTAQLEKLEKKGRKLDAQVAIAKQNMAELEQRIELTVGGSRTTNTEELTRTTSRGPGTAHLATHIEPRGEREERSLNRQGSSGPVLSMQELNSTFQEHASRHNSIEVVGYAGGDEIDEDDNHSEKGEDEEEEEEEEEEEDDDDNPAEEEAESESEQGNGSDDDDEDAERARMDSHHMDGGSRARTSRPDRVKAKTGSKLVSSATTRNEEQSIEDGSSESSEESEEEDDEAANSARKSTKAEKKAAKKKAKKESKRAQRKAEQEKAEKRAKRAEKQLRKAAKRAVRDGTAQTEEGAATLLSLAGRDTMSAQPGQSPREDNAGGSKQQRKELKKAKTSSIRNLPTGASEDLSIFDVPGSPTPGPSSLRLASDRRERPASSLGSAQGLMGPPPRPGTTERTQVPLRTPSSSKKRKAAPDGAVDASKTRRVDGNLGPSSHKQREPRSAALKGRERTKAHATWNGYSSDRQSVALADSEDEMGRFIIQKP